MLQDPSKGITNFLDQSEDRDNSLVITEIIVNSFVIHFVRFGNS